LIWFLKRLRVMTIFGWRRETNDRPVSIRFTISDQLLWSSDHVNYRNGRKFYVFQTWCDFAVDMRERWYQFNVKPMNWIEYIVGLSRMVFDGLLVQLWEIRWWKVIPDLEVDRREANSIESNGLDKTYRNRNNWLFNGSIPATPR
jgi:hypothetical protein